MTTKHITLIRATRLREYIVVPIKDIRRIRDGKRNCTSIVHVANQKTKLVDEIEVRGNYIRLRYYVERVK